MFGKKNIELPVEVSARHLHLSKDDCNKLFGVGYELKKLRQLTQPADFACEETVDVHLGSKKIEGVRVVGPFREKTQIEISLTDAASSGIKPPVRISGQLSGSCPVVLDGPKGFVSLNEGLIIALRHIHCATMEAKKLGLVDGAKVDVEVKEGRPVIFKDVVVRVKDEYKLCLHLDTDEGNAAGINKIGKGFIIK